MSYWASRAGMRYYRVAADLVRQHAKHGSVLDVGSADTRVLELLPEFRERTALDVGTLPDIPGVRCIHGDFREHQGRYDAVLCLQVLEHLKDPAEFTARLFRAADCVVLSVPYRWCIGEPGHVHDPVDEAKLESWTTRQPVACEIVWDRMPRLVAAYV